VMVRLSPTSDLAGCCAATAVRPEGLGHREALVWNDELGHRSARSAREPDSSLAIGAQQLANSSHNCLGRVAEPHDSRITRFRLGTALGRTGLATCSDPSRSF
jgi:hypothetical protein